MQTAAWVLGYHGCDREIGEAALAGATGLRPSENDWDWLGSGIYFWENNARRALEWASYAKDNPVYFANRIREPFVLGAILDLGNCLDLTEADSIRLVKEAHEELREVLAAVGAEMPRNAGAPPDRVIRRLDCAVINYVHGIQDREQRVPFNSVRAAFFEGESLYENAGFHTKTHVQLCVRDEAQVVGYFRVREF